MNQPLEIWASPEPSTARIDDRCVRDQSAETGHDTREDDIERLAALGICAARYPVLWERVAPLRPDVLDFTWCDRRLEMMQGAGIEPIVTLLHHGSGPLYTSLVDPSFPFHFANYARTVARRYPFVCRWTPINEPLTTARFATLYGKWYPNRFFDHEAFGRAITNEALATVLAMRAIRETIPEAQLMLTEDLQGFMAADRAAEAYVEHKLERRFLSAELVMGRVDENHSLRKYLTHTCAVPSQTLDDLRRVAMPIDLMGWNYYPLSERVVSRVGSGFRNMGLVDVDARLMAPRARFREANKRLSVPIALSEVHCMGHEAERTRWLLQRFDDACALRAEGVDVRAFGAWAAFGMVDWRSLLCKREGASEDGIYTFAGAGGTAVPAPTMVAQAVRALADGIRPGMPAERGWWELDAVA